MSDQIDEARTWWAGRMFRHWSERRNRPPPGMFGVRASAATGRRRNQPPPGMSRAEPAQGMRLRQLIPRLRVEADANRLFEPWYYRTTRTSELTNDEADHRAIDHRRVINARGESISWLMSIPMVGTPLYIGDIWWKAWGGLLKSLGFISRLRKRVALTRARGDPSETERLSWMNQAMRARSRQRTRMRRMLSYRDN